MGFEPICVSIIYFIFNSLIQQGTPSSSLVASPPTSTALSYGMAFLLNPTARRLALAACRRLSMPAAAEQLVLSRNTRGLPCCPVVSLLISLENQRFGCFRNQELAMLLALVFSFLFFFLFCSSVLIIGFCGIPSISLCPLLLHHILLLRT
jgi:hypothetical protein